MASKKYAYYMKGNRLALIQKNTSEAYCSLSGYENKSDCEAAGGTWYASGAFRNDSSDYGKYMSPTETVSNGLEIEYTYSPWYRVNDASVSIPCESYDEDGNGLLKIVDAQNALPQSGKTHIVIKNSDRFNGLHEISSFDTGTGGYLVLKTKYNGASVTDSMSVYTDVSVMQDEDFELDLTRYQANAIVYYLKAMALEEAQDIKGREYYMRLFRKQMEKATGSRKSGPYIIQGYKGMRR